jgi:hypothetical protein
MNKYRRNGNVKTVCRDVHFFHSVVSVVKLGRMQWAGYIAWKGETRNACRIRL